MFFSGFWFYEYGFSIGVLTVVSLLILLKAIRRDLKFKISSIILVLTLIGLVVSSEILSYTLLYSSNDFPFLQTTITLTMITMAFLFSETIPMNKFKKNFVICIVLISIVSLVSFFINIINPSLIRIFPEFINSHDRTSYFLFFSMVSNDISRNQGIFWEPGAFQFFLGLAYIFELSKSDSNPRKWILILFIISFVSTVSTTGIVVVFLLVAYTFSKYRGKSNVIRAIVIVFLLLAVLLSVIPYLNSEWQYALVDKIQGIFSYQPGANIGVVSSSRRMDSLYYPLNEFLNSPIWGIGKSGYDKVAQGMGHGILTFTPINLLAMFGPIYGLIVLIGIYNFFKKSFKVSFDSIVIFSIFLLSTTTEALQNNIFILAMCFIGWKYYSKNIIFTKNINLGTNNY